MPTSPAASCRAAFAGAAVVLPVADCFRYKRKICGGWLTHFRRGRTTMPTQQELPEQFGRYRVLGKLGVGGMGAVYLAEDSKLRRKVALKVPHFKNGARTTVLERFEREARLAASIEHP